MKIEIQFFFLTLFRPGFFRLWQAGGVSQRHPPPKILKISHITIKLGTDVFQPLLLRTEQFFFFRFGPFGNFGEFWEKKERKSPNLKIACNSRTAELFRRKFYNIDRKKRSYSLVKIFFVKIWSFQEFLGKKRYEKWKFRKKRKKITKFSRKFFQ